VGRAPQESFCAAAISSYECLEGIILDRGQWGFPIDRRLLYPEAKVLKNVSRQHDHDCGDYPD
jgi:hypothetical protein